MEKGFVLFTSSFLLHSLFAKNTFLKTCDLNYFKMWDQKIDLLAIYIQEKWWWANCKH